MADISRCDMTNMTVHRYMAGVVGMLVGPAVAEHVMLGSREGPAAAVDDWDCFKGMVGTFEAECTPLLERGLGYARALANLCNEGFPPQDLVEAARVICL